MVHDTSIHVSFDWPQPSAHQPYQPGRRLVLAQAPKSILKKTKVYDLVNRNINMDGVSWKEPHNDNDADVSDLESEDSALCLRDASDSDDALFGLNHAPAPGNSE